MYNNIKFKKLVKPYREEHKHGGTESNFKLVSVPDQLLRKAPTGDPPEHVLCALCGIDLTYLIGKSEIDLTEEFSAA